MQLFESISHYLRPKEQLPSTQAFADVREEFVTDRSVRYFQFLSTSNDFINFVEWSASSSFSKEIESVERLSNYLAHFELGLTLVHKKMRTRFSNNNIFLSVQTIAADHDAFIYVPKGIKIKKECQDKYLIQLKKAFKLAVSTNSLARVKDHWCIPNLSIEDLFLLAGVEEAAHRHYDRKKNKRTQISEAKFAGYYHTTDLEYRALFWKIYMARRYLPQYTDALRKFKLKMKKRREVRLSSIRNDSP